MSADDGRRRLAEFLATQPMTADITGEQVARAQSRDDLGITSLNMILILLSYIRERTNDTVTLRPEWVSRLGDVNGIVSVLREIDAAAANATASDPARTGATATDTVTAGATATDTVTAAAAATDTVTAAAAAPGRAAPART